MNIFSTLCEMIKIIEARVFSVLPNWFLTVGYHGLGKRCGEIRRKAKCLVDGLWSSWLLHQIEEGRIMDNESRGKQAGLRFCGLWVGLPAPDLWYLLSAVTGATVLELLPVGVMLEQTDIPLASSHLSSRWQHTICIKHVLFCKFFTAL